MQLLCVAAFCTVSCCVLYSSFLIGALLGKFVEEKESLKSFLRGRRQNVQHGDTAALREVFSDKQEKLMCFFESWYQGDAVSPVSQFTQTSGQWHWLELFYVTLLGLPFWSCPLQMPVSIACSQRGWLVCDSCSAAQKSHGSDFKEELNCFLCSKDMLKMHSYFFDFLLKIGIASSSWKASCNKWKAVGS